MNNSEMARILLAEDDESLLEAFGMFLKSRGYEVTAAADGLSALRELQAGMHDLLITDLNMPGLTGENLLERVKEMPDDARPAVIVVTGHGTLESAIKGISAGVSAYIHKPFNFMEAETAIKTAVEKKRLEAALKIYYRDLDRKVEERTSELDRKVNQLFILNSMGGRARVTTSLTETSMMLVSSIAQAIGFDRVCLWLLDKEKTTLSLAACQGIDNRMAGGPMVVDSGKAASVDFVKGEPVIVPGSICGRFLGNGDDSQETSGEVVMAPLVVHDPEVVQLKCWEHYQCGHTACPAHEKGSLACWMVPGSCIKKSGGDNLLDKMEVCRKCVVYVKNTSGKSIGLICADNYTSGRRVAHDDLKVLSIFANSAATIIENLLLMERLLHNEKFTDNIITNMASGLMVTDPHGRVQMINRAGAEIFRSDPGYLTGKNIGALFPEARQFLAVEPAAAMGHEVTVNILGAAVPIGYTNSFLAGHNGRREGTIVLFKDLSEIVKLREQLREKERFAAIGKVAAGVAHEIRNPLFGITSVAQILARETKDDQPVKELITAMLSETSRLNTLVEDMLLYGRSTKLSPQPVDISQLIENVLLFHQAAIKEKGLVITKYFDNVPPAMLDINQMRQVLLNLLVNAVDASAAGGEIRLGTKKADGTLIVSISDDGIGIPRSDLPKVFDLFYTTKEKGTGLGLAICRKIIEDHEGCVSIESREGRGTTVELRLKAGQ